MSKSPLYKENFFKIKIDTFYNELKIRFSVSEEMARFNFLKSAEGDTLSLTSFSFTLLKNSIPIQNPVLLRESKNGYNSYANGLSGPVISATDTFDMRSSFGYDEFFNIPLCAFNTLKSGANDLELIGSQNIFCSNYKRSKTDFNVDPETHDTTFRNYRNITKAVLFSFKIRFRINIPPIYKTTLYGYGITLRNDSIYSPAGMDNTLWKSSYPDIYWSISCPSDKFYCNSDYQTSTDHYNALDTFHLFYYSPADSITINVFDHDGLSRDDYISWQKFNWNQFPNNRLCKMSYGNIKLLELKAKHEGIINKTGR